MLEFERKIIKKFALNYRASINGKWYEVYRVDNYHGFLHEQRFWRSPEPMPLETDMSLNEVVEHYVEKISLNFPKYRRYFIEMKRKE
ncbi:MAG: hypothetical protein ABIG93_04625 [archaeon]